VVAAQKLGAHPILFDVNERDEARQGVTEVNGFKELPAILK
jgi:hypothetical protein